jgi:hypothetical protein
VDGDDDLAVRTGVETTCHMIDGKQLQKTCHVVFHRGGGILWLVTMTLPVFLPLPSEHSLPLTPSTFERARAQSTRREGLSSILPSPLMTLPCYATALMLEYSWIATVQGYVPH